MKYKKLKENFRKMDTCEIHPSSVKIGSLEKYNYIYRIVPLEEQDIVANQFIFSGIEYEYRIGTYETIEEEKVLIELIPDSNIYIDLSQINSNHDLHKIRNCIKRNGIKLGKKALDCENGETRVIKGSLKPYFEDSVIDTPINIKQLKKIVEKK